MNKKGDLMDNIMINYVVYIIIVVAVFLILFFWIVGYQDGAVVWEDFYAKEIVRIVDLAEPGTVVFLDVTKGAEIAFNNKKSREDIFSFDNVNNMVSVSLRNEEGTSFSFFNDVDVVDWEFREISGGAETHRLYFRVTEVQA